MHLNSQEMAPYWLLVRKAVQCWVAYVVQRQGVVSLNCSVFHTVVGMRFCQIFCFGHSNPGKRGTRATSPKFHNTIGKEKQSKNHFALLQGGCSEVVAHHFLRCFGGMRPDYHGVRNMSYLIWQVGYKFWKWKSIKFGRTLIFEELVGAQQV